MHFHAYFNLEYNRLFTKCRLEERNLYSVFFLKVAADTDVIEKRINLADETCDCVERILDILRVTALLCCLGNRKAVERSVLAVVVALDND